MRAGYARTSLSFGERFSASAIFFVSGYKGWGVCVGGESAGGSEPEPERTIIVRLRSWRFDFGGGF
jgi:hypothetical protein